MITAFVIAVHVIVSLMLVLLILLHSGRGGGLSDMFGGGMGGTSAGSTVVISRAWPSFDFEHAYWKSTALMMMGGVLGVLFVSLVRRVMNAT